MARRHATDPKQSSFTVYFTEDQHNALTAASLERDVSKCQVIRELVNKWRREMATADA